MKSILLRSVRAFALAAFAVTLGAEDSTVFRFMGSNAFETIEGELALNRAAVRTMTATGFSFASPVNSLRYSITSNEGVIGEFTFTTANPNSLVITKGPGAATSFRLLVEPVPTDPPFPGPPAFVMEFSFPGASPWGDDLPDRTIAGATNVRLGASDEYAQAVSIVEVAGEIAAIEAELAALEAAFAAAFKNPGFKLPGATPSERVAALTMGLDRLSQGQRKQLHAFWNAAP